MNLKRRSFITLLAGLATSLVAPALATSKPVDSAPPSAPDNSHLPDPYNYEFADSSVRGYFEGDQFVRVYERVTVVNDGRVTARFNPAYMDAPVEILIYTRKAGATCEPAVITIAKARDRHSPPPTRHPCTR